MDTEKQLTDEQNLIIETVLKGKSLFFTGSAGTGKSFLLRTLIKILEDKKSDLKLFITASTGIAAVNVGGTTVHSFSGIGLGGENKETLLKKVSCSLWAREKWLQCDILIVDEISMLLGDIFEKIEYIGSKIRQNDKPFGGIQVILCGDFFQLPPVAINPNIKHIYCFQTPAWEKTIGNSVYQLTKVFRQDDLKFVSLLNRIRIGDLNQEVIKELDSIVEKTKKTKSSDDYVKLYPHKTSVESINKNFLTKLNKPIKTFVAQDNGKETFVNSLKKHCQAVDRLQLCEGARVICIFNIDVERQIVNGSRGTVVGFETYPIVLFSNGVTEQMKPFLWEIKDGKKTLATRRQVPLILAWALTVHKSQGMGIDKLEIDLKDVFEHGQGYVALSRATSLDGLRLLNYTKQKISADPIVMDFDYKIQQLCVSDTLDNLTKLKLEYKK
jgi:ATP-dependent DNA helicase PIF1